MPASRYRLKSSFCAIRSSLSPISIALAIVRSSTVARACTRSLRSCCPLRDRNPTVRTPVITIALIVVNVAVFLLIQKGGTLGQQDDTKLTYEHAAIPCELTQGHPLTEREIVTDTCTERRSPEVFPDKSVLLSVFVSMFLHGGWLHLGGNMLFLWVFGNNVEDKLGSVLLPAPVPRGRCGGDGSRRSRRTRTARFPSSAHPARSRQSWARTSCGSRASVCSPCS